MKLHGAAVMAALFLCGSVLNAHIRRALKGRHNRMTGWAMISVLSALTLTGYALYYVAGESDRAVWSTIHWAIGLVLPVVVVLHIVLGRKSVSKA
jgi:cytochrome bd-type quinol oxidase subunit 2